MQYMDGMDARATAHRELEELKAALAQLERPRNAAVEPPIGLMARRPDDKRVTVNVPEMLDLVREERGLLIEDIQRLRDRLAPLLSGRDGSAPARELPAVSCQMSSELGEIYLTLIGARERIELILAQLEI